MVRNVNYALTRGLPWDRLIIVKNKYQHRLLRPTESRAYIKTGDSSKYEITTSITTENGILLSLTGSQTRDLPVGKLEYDVFATISDIQRPVSKGTITVSDLNNISPLEDSQAMEIRFKQYTDFRESYSWKDSDGNVLSVQSAYMQAEDADKNTVLDLRWFATAPDEATIANLPANQRGYIAPKAGQTLEIHISDKNNIPAGSYPFDLMVQDSAGDWSFLTGGTVVVEYSVSSPPV
jgi:hypothetical protein